jgi:cephalosporin-C deacetylase-like acetyl esterase
VYRLCLLLCCAAILCSAQGSDSKRKQTLVDLKSLLTPSNTKATARINSVDRTWNEWTDRTGELPPDFDKLPSQPFLPDPLAGVRTREDWGRRRAEIRTLIEQWITGRMPPAPGNVRSIVTGEKKEGGVTIRDVRLEFGPDRKASLRVQLVIPPGKGPFPVFLTNHARNRPWIAPAVRRGYIGCIYFAADPIYGSSDDSDKFIEVYPEYDFSALARWAWAAMRAVDYLHTLAEVDVAKIGIAGHSRNGKQALIAAAFDERITAAIPSSGNTGEGDPWRYTTDPFVNESIEQITSGFPGWFHPRLRFFAGREHKLPVDQNSMMALVAPRGLLMMSAYSESQGNSFGFEQAYRSVRRVYDLMGAVRNVGLLLRPGEHPTTAEDIEVFVDFFDTVFGRSKRPAPRTQMHPYSFDWWRQWSGETAETAAVRGTEFHPPASAEAWKPRRYDIRKRIQWILGDEPAAAPFPARKNLEGTTRTHDGWLATLYGRPVRADSVKSYEIGFGDDLKADLYVPQAATGKFPVVIWLHPYAYPTGYSRNIRPTIAALTGIGYAVFAFDQIGFGTRIEQAIRFYERYPHWSLLGKMVADTRAAVDALTALDAVDSSRIYLAGYSLGGKVALFSAALDDRIAGVIAASAFTPLRTSSTETEGLRHYYDLHGLLPRLGFFAGREQHVPIDYDEIIASVAPRHVYLRAPTFDRYAIAADVRDTVERSRAVYRLLGAEGNLELHTPLDFNRFKLEAQKEAFSALNTWRKQ